MRSLVLVIASAAVAACSSDADYAGTGVVGVDGGDASAADGRDGAGDGGDGATDTGGNLVTGVRVFSGTAKMLFNGPSCTNDASVTGDRWCAFVTYTDATMQARSLYVFNASRAVAGADVRCGGGASTDACLLLTADLWGDSSNPVIHGTFFQGDTLVFYEHGFAPYVWRPGMSGGRLLASRSATFGHIL